MLHLALCILFTSLEAWSSPPCMMFLVSVEGRSRWGGRQKVSSVVKQCLQLVDEYLERRRLIAGRRCLEVVDYDEECWSLDGDDKFGQLRHRQQIE